MRVLVVSGIVITALVYPAIAIQLYAPSSGQFSSRVSDTWLFYKSRTSTPHVQEFWETHDALRLRDEPAVVARCGIQSTIGIERLYLRGYPSDGGYLGFFPSIIPGFDLQRRLLDSFHGLPPCVRDDAGNCIILSPLQDQHRPATETDFLKSLSPPVSVAGIPVPVECLVAGQTNGMDSIIDPEYLVLSFMSHIDDCQSPTPHHHWVEAVRDAAGPNAVVTPTFSLPRLVALEVRIGRVVFLIHYC